MRYILDLDFKNFQRRELKQFDNEIIEIEVVRSGQPFSLVGYTAELHASNSKGQAVIQTQGIAIANNMITIPLIEDITRVSGEVKLEVQLLKNGKKKTTFTFKLLVNESVLEGANLQPSIIIDIIEVLENKITLAQQVKKDTEQLIQSGGAATKGDVQTLTSQMADITYFVTPEQFGAKQDGTISTKAFKDMIAYMSVSGKSFCINFSKGLGYLIDDQIDIPSYCTVNGNGGTIKSTNMLKPIFKSYGVENNFKEITFDGGKNAVLIDTANVDRCTVNIINCNTKNQADYSFTTTTVSQSTLLNIVGGKHVSSNGLADVGTDLTTIKDLWLSALTSGKSYIKNRTSLVVENCLLVPQCSPSLTTAFISNEGYNISCKNVRFGGETGGICTIINKTKEKISNVDCTISMDKCSFWGSNSDVILNELPKNLIIRNSNVVGLSVVESYATDYTVKCNIVSDVILSYKLAKFNYENGKSLSVRNYIDSNSYFFGFRSLSKLGNGSISNSIEYTLHGVLSKVILEGTSGDLYASWDREYTLRGMYTLRVSVKTDKDISVTTIVGNTQKEHYISASDKFTYIYTVGNLTDNNKTIYVAINNTNVKTTVEIGNPHLFKGNSESKAIVSGTCTDDIEMDSQGNASLYNKPSNGWWNTGCIVYNIAPTIGSPIGWITTSTGNAANVFKGFGVITS